MLNFRQASRPLGADYESETHVRDADRVCDIKMDAAVTLLNDI